MEASKQKKHYIKKEKSKDLIKKAVENGPKNYGQIMNKTHIPRSSLAGLLNWMVGEGKLRRLDNTNLEDRKRFGIKDMDGRKVFYVEAEDASLYAIQIEVIDKISGFLETLEGDKSDRKQSLTKEQVQIYIEELVEGLSKELRETLDINNLFKLYRISEDGRMLIRDEKKRIQLLFGSLEALISRTRNEKFESVEFRDYVTKKISAHLKTLINNKDAQESNSVTDIISKLLIILGNIGYEFLENVVCYILQIDGKDAGGRALDNVLSIKAEERDKIDPNQIFWIIQKCTHHGESQYSPYLNQLIKDNVDRMFRKQVAVINSNPKLAEILKKIRSYAKDIPLK